MARDELGAYASLHAFLVANGLGAYEAAIQELGAMEVSDLADLSEADLQGVRSTHAPSVLVLICIEPSI